MLSVFVVLALTGSALLYLYLRKNLDYFKKNNVVHFESNLFLGHFKDLVFMRKCPVDIIQEIYDHENFQDQPYGGVFLMQTPGIFIRNIDLIKRIVITDSNKFIDHYAATQEGDTIGINNMFFTKGQKWKHLRKNMLQAYTSSRIKNMFHLIDEVSCC